ncbi:hypothetical protein [Pannonibacter phragmitetus]|uniref:hypothetical protein n=1 Tax=Pannonibacter phragmitetus TaxID=121719 RepID=UPI003D2EA735
MHSIVDDLLGQFQQDVADRIRQDREKENEELLPGTELPDEAKKAFSIVKSSLAKLLPSLYWYDVAS